MEPLWEFLPPRFALSTSLFFHLFANDRFTGVVYIMPLLTSEIYSFMSYTYLDVCFHFSMLLFFAISFKLQNSLFLLEFFVLECTINSVLFRPIIFLSISVSPFFRFSFRTLLYSAFSLAFRLVTSSRMLPPRSPIDRTCRIVV